MKMKWINIMLIICMAGVFGSCEKQESEKFEGDACLYFYRGSRGTGQQDSIRHSFFLIPEGQERDTILVDVRTMGFPADFNRPVKIVQTNAGEAGAAVAGVHYIGFDDAVLKEAMIIPANAVKMNLPVIVLHDPSLNTGKVRLEMAVVENEYFKPGIDKDCRFMVSTTAMAEKPDTWETWWKTHFGEWGVEKMTFIINYLGFSEFEETDLETGYKTYLRLKAWDKLSDYNDAHPGYPLCEDKDKYHPNDVPCDRCVIFP